MANTDNTNVTALEVAHAILREMESNGCNFHKALLQLKSFTVTDSKRLSHAMDDYFKTYEDDPNPDDLYSSRRAVCFEVEDALYAANEFDINSSHAQWLIHDYTL